MIKRTDDQMNERMAKFMGREVLMLPHGIHARPVPTPFYPDSFSLLFEVLEKLDVNFCIENFYYIKGKVEQSYTVSIPSEKHCSECGSQADGVWVNDKSVKRAMAVAIDRALGER